MGLINKCEVCGGEMWGQRGNKDEEAQGISYRVCTNKRCENRIKIKWNAEKQVIIIIH